MHNTLRLVLIVYILNVSVFHLLLPCTVKNDEFARAVKQKEE